MKKLESLNKSKFTVLNQKNLGTVKVVEQPVPISATPVLKPNTDLVLTVDQIYTYALFTKHGRQMISVMDMNTIMVQAPLMEVGLM
ncbi:hypothetical protein LWM68_15530 [Niabella sp. W65]|nr:hypothetical protein [Niabella sp. W65]MCH7364040.1 hypothetical protein [Niabella sp. W65]ULT39918.1 hypothetical protein KRR40_34335 [Niabella sp. I65]